MTAADACPGILDLHAARDGLVARIRLPGGYATATRLGALSAMSARFGDGHVDLTARGNLQLRGVSRDLADDLARRAVAAGLLPSPAHDRARNIAASPLAGLGGRPDLRALVRSLDRAIRADAGLTALPGRFLFCLDDGTGRAGLGGCDVGLRVRAGRADLIVAGCQTGLRGPAAHVVGLAIAAARTFLRHRPAADPPSRIAGLPGGGAAVAAALGGTLGDRVSDVTARLPLGPVAGPVPLAVVAAPLGRLTASQLRLIARLLRSGETARLTMAGRIVLPLGQPADQAMPQLAAAGLLTAADDPLAAVTACSGTACVSSLADVRSLAAPVPGQAAVHWAGCARRCGRPADATAVVALTADTFAVADPGAGRILAVTNGAA
jgi:precorrin-3B synthase